MKPNSRKDSRLVHFSEDEIESQLVEKKGGPLFLGRYSLDDITVRLEKSGILGAIRSQGFPDLHVDVDTQDPFHHRITLRDTARDDQEHLLGEIRISEGTFTPRKHFVSKVTLEELRTIIIEWMCLQNPRKDFSPGRPRLPGQKYPGLGVARKVLDLLVDLARSLHKDGILNFPEYYHNAAIYSEIFLFYNPTMQGMLHAMMRDLGVHPLEKVSQAVHDGMLRDARSGEKFEWSPEEQILPISARTRNYFSSESYTRMRDDAVQSWAFEIKWNVPHAQE